MGKGQREEWSERKGKKPMNAARVPCQLQCKCQVNNRSNKGKERTADTADGCLSRHAVSVTSLCCTQAVVRAPTISEPAVDRAVLRQLDV